MIKNKEKGGFFGKALAAACSLALVASLTPAAAVSAFAANTTNPLTPKNMPWNMDIVVEQIGSQGNVVASDKMTIALEKQNADKSIYTAAELLNSGATGNISANYYAGNRWGVATVSASSAASFADLIAKNTGNDLKLDVAGLEEADYGTFNPTVTIESGYSSSDADGKNGLIADFCQTVTTDWKSITANQNYYPDSTSAGIVEPQGGTKLAGGYIVNNGSSTFQDISGTAGQAGDTTAAQIAAINDQQLADNKVVPNGYTFVQGLNANNVANHDTTAAAKMVQGVKKITIQFPYRGLEDIDRLWGTNWDDTMNQIYTAAKEKATGDAENANLNTDTGTVNDFEPNTYVVATAGGYEDALAASGFAGLINAPLLMTDPGELTDTTKDIIDDNNTNNAKKIYLVGGPNAVSNKVQEELEAIKGVGDSTDGFVKRIWGTNSWDTSLALYNEGISLKKTWSNDVIIATSIDFMDALSISPYAYADKVPVILTTGDATLSDDVAAAMQDAITATSGDVATYGKIGHATIVGGTSVVKTSVNNQLLNIPINRLWGMTGYDTSNAIAEFLYTTIDKFENGTTASIATGIDYLDALSSCNLSGQKNMVLLLADASDTTTIDNFLTKYGPNYKKYLGKEDFAVIYGGTSVVSEAVAIAANEAVAAK